MIMKGLNKAAREMTVREGFLKLVISMLFVPVPIVALTLGGFWLDYYELNTTPLFLALGVVLGTSISFVGVCKIITYGH
jgi:F0F1-type ATP synthase assembly protein I